MASPPPLSTLESLPSGILGEICGLLATDKIGRRGLFALSLTSAELSHETLRFRLRSIRLKVQDAAKLRRDLEDWREIFQVSGNAEYVRQLRIDGYMPQRGLDRPRSWSEQLYPSIYDTDNGLWEDDGSFWGHRDFLKPTFFRFAEAVLTEEEKVKHEKEWSPLVSFIAKFPHLKEVVYTCENQILPSFLAALHSHPQKPRLHVHSFSLRSLFHDRSARQDIDADEYLLASSPCLTSIRARDSWTSDDGVSLWGFNHEAILRMAAGVSPNLKSVSIHWSPPGMRPDDLSPPNLAWPGFFPSNSVDSDSQASKGCLETLAFSGSGIISSLTIMNWHHHIDFTVLRSLHLRSRAIRFAALEALAEICKAGAFKSLECLVMLLNQTMGERPEQFYHVVAEVLASMPPLTQLKLSGAFSAEAFNAAIHTHGRSLRRLSLNPGRGYGYGDIFVLTSSRVEALSQGCPNVEDLELLTPRTHSDEEEARIYRAIGEMRHLDSVSLFLDCSRPVRQEDYDDDDDDAGALPLPAHCFRDPFINAAVDADLASDIMDCLSLHRSPRVIMLNTQGIDEFQTDEALDDDFSVVESCLGSGWLRVKDTRPGREGEFCVTELRREERLHGEECLKEPNCYKAILRSIWPDAKAYTKAEMKSFRLWKG